MTAGLWALSELHNTNPKFVDNTVYDYTNIPVTWDNLQIVYTIGSIGVLVLIIPFITKTINNIKKLLYTDEAK